MGPSDLSDFLSHAVSQKAASLLISRDPERAIRTLEAEGFKNLQDPRDLEKGGKHYVWLTEENAKELYDLALQYGTGQINYFDTDAHEQVWVSPAYKDSSLVIVLKKDVLRDVEESGLPIREVAGIALQAA